MPTSHPTDKKTVSHWPQHVPLSNEEFARLQQLALHHTGIQMTESKRDLISLGAYKYGSDERVDLAIDMIEEMEGLLKQGLEERSSFEETVDLLLDMFG